jgi:hypothetical protein
MCAKIIIKGNYAQKQKNNKKCFDKNKCAKIIIKGQVSAKTK